MNDPPHGLWPLLTAQLVNRMTGFVQPVLVLYLTQDQRLSPATAGQVLSGVGAGVVVSHLLGGWLADRVGRRRTILLGFVGTAAGLTALVSARSVPAMLLTAFLVGVMADFFRPAASAIIADLLGPRDRVRAYSLLTWAANLGFSIATAVAAVAASHGLTAVFWANAAGSLLAGVLILWAVPEPRPAIARRVHRAALPIVARDRLMLATLALLLVYGTLYFQIFSTLALAMLADGHGTATYALLMTLNGLLIVALQPLAGKYLAGHDPAQVIAASMLLVGLGQGAGAVVHSLAGYAAGAVIWTAGEIGMGTMFGAVFAALAPTDLRGRYLGLAGTTCWGLGALIGPVAGTATLTHAGSTTLWSACALVGALLALTQLALAPHLRRRLLAPVPDAGPADTTPGTRFQP